MSWREFRLGCHCSSCLQAIEEAREASRQAYAARIAAQSVRDKGESND